MDDEWMGGLIQTSFIVCYVIAAPIFGYLGDRYSRKWLIIVGIFMWSSSIMASSFMPVNKSQCKCVPVKVSHLYIDTQFISYILILVLLAIFDRESNHGTWRIGVHSFSTHVVGGSISWDRNYLRISTVLFFHSCREVISHNFRLDMI